MESIIWRELDRRNYYIGRFENEEKQYARLVPKISMPDN
jgi:hypothetical protein